MLQNHEFRASVLVIAKTALSLGIAFCFKALEVEGVRKRKGTREEEKPFVPTIKDSLTASSLYFNIIHFPRTSSNNIPEIEYTKLVGVEKKLPVGGRVDIFRNSILTELVAFHNRNLFTVLEKCDFKSSPELTKYILSYQEANGLNLLNIAIRNRIAIGNQIMEKVVDTYVDNLDKKILLKSLDKFVLTLPPDQLRKIIDKVGGEELLEKFGKEKLKKSEIKKVISVFHSPNIFPRLKNKGQTEFEFDGYDRSTVVNMVHDSEKAYDLIKNGNLFQVNDKLMKELISEMGMTEDEIKKHPYIYLSIKNDFSGLLAGRKPDGNVDPFLHGKFDTSQTALENFVKNVQDNQRFLKENFSEKVKEKIPNQALSKGNIKFPQQEL